MTQTWLRYTPIAMAFAATAFSPEAVQAKAPAVKPDLQIVSFSASHDRLAPGTGLTLNLLVKGVDADAPPFEIGLYYAFGDNATPQQAKRFTLQAARNGVKKDGLTTFSVPVRAPWCTTCGPVTLTAYVDPFDRIRESNEKNNRALAKIVLDPAALPDLRVERASLSPQAGVHTDKVMVKARVRNDSRVSAQGPFRTSIYCSADPQITPIDTLLYSSRWEALAPQATLNVAREVQLLPNCRIRGLSTWVGVLTDDQNEVLERNDQNNAASARYDVQRAADLTPGKISVNGHNSPIAGRIGLSFKVNNLGGDRAGAFEVGVFLSKDAVITPEDTQLDSLSMPSLAANTESGTLHSVVTVPPLPLGQYYLGILVDVAGKNGELRKRNNFKAEALKVDAVDLSDAYLLAARPEASHDEELDMTFAVRNRGETPAGQSHVSLYYSEDPRFDQGVDALLGSHSVEALAAGQQSKEQAMKVKLPSSAQEGYRFILMVVDDEDQISETDEFNNVALRPIHIVRPAAQ